MTIAVDWDKQNGEVRTVYGPKVFEINMIFLAGKCQHFEVVKVIK